MKKDRFPFADKIDARMVEKFLFLNLSHLSCFFKRGGVGVCSEVVEEFGQYLESRGITTKEGIGIFQHLSLLQTSGIKSLERAEQEMDKVKHKDEEGTENEGNYNPNFPI